MRSRFVVDWRWWVRRFGAAAAVFGLIAASPLAARPYNLLVLHSNNRLVPGNVAVDRGLRDSLASAGATEVLVFSEFLDTPEFSGTAYEQTLTTYLHDKYASHPPDALLTVSDAALEFATRHRQDLFPAVPLVHAVASTSLVRRLAAAHANVVGVPIEYDFAGTIEQALRFHPKAQRLVVVTGTSDRDRAWEARLRREVPLVAGVHATEFLAGLPTTSLLSRLSQLDDSAVVFTTGYFADGTGALFSPREAAAGIAKASSAPVYGPFDTFIGTGAVGGRMPSFEDVGRQAGAIVARLAAGASPSSVQVPEVTPTALQLDWRQVKRFGIDEAAIPADALLHFREPTFWEQYRVVAIAGISVILLQAALITALLLEHRRRRMAEVAVQEQRVELAHASRLAVAGELTASIAHEINQPLAAVQTSADAADLLLRSNGERRVDLLRIITRIRRDNMRASDVIRRLRTLLARHEPDRIPFDLSTAVNDVATILRAEARRRNVVLDFGALSRPFSVLGDQTQIQQVLINLLLNAMDATADLPPDRRIVAVAAEAVGADVRITVRDSGHGIPTEHLPKLFDSFFSTKQQGMGLGLSIARTIVEAHGGRILAESKPGEGTTFTVQLPVCEARAESP